MYKLYIFLFMLCAAQINAMDENLYFVAVAPQFEQCSFPKDSGCCIGHVNQPDGTYRLRVCDNETGLPVWESPIACKVKHPYSIADNTLFYATDEKEVVQLDLNTHKKNIIEKAKHKILALKAIDRNTYYTLYSKNAAITYAAKKQKREITFVANNYPHKVFFTENYLVLPTATSFGIIDHNGNYNKIPHFNAASPLAVPYIATVKNIIAYQVTSPENGKRWVRCLELTPTSEIAAAREICNIPALRNVKKMAFSPDAIMLYILTDFSLKAIAINESRSERFKWETPIDPSKIDNIYITASGGIYGHRNGSCVTSNTLYKFNPKLGYAKCVTRDLPPTYSIVGDRIIDGIDQLYVELPEQFFKPRS